MELLDHSTPNADLEAKVLDLFCNKHFFHGMCVPKKQQMTGTGFESTTSTAGAGHSPLMVHWHGKDRTLLLSSMKDISKEDQQVQIGPLGWTPLDEACNCSAICLPLLMVIYHDSRTLIIHHFTDSLGHSSTSFDSSLVSQNGGLHFCTSSDS